MIIASAVDYPSDGGIVQRHGFVLSGWAITAPEIQVAEVVVRCGDAQIGRTRHFYARPDVSEALKLRAGTRCAFAIDCRVAESLRTGNELAFSVFAIDTLGRSYPLETRAVRFSQLDYRGGAHGYVFAGDFDQVLGRDQIYATGPPSPLADGHCVELLTRYLTPGSRILDVGCGIGAYAGPLAEKGMVWTGCEVRTDFVDEARGKGLDVRLVTGDHLPFDDASFDVTIAIEVLEHIPDFHAFLRETRRVASTAFFSVPNFEVIPITAHFYALPWHMLEPDHRNFFTHGSLAATLSEHYDEVEVTEYGPLPSLHAADGLPLHNHLFAIANSRNGHKA